MCIFFNRQSSRRRSPKKTFFFSSISLYFFLYLSAPTVPYILYTSPPCFAPDFFISSFDDDDDDTMMLPLLHVFAIAHDLATPLFVGGLGLFFIVRTILLILEASSRWDSGESATTTQNDPSSEPAGDASGAGVDPTPSLDERLRPSMNRATEWIEEHWLDVLCDQRTYVAILLPMAMCSPLRHADYEAYELTLEPTFVYWIGLSFAICGWVFSAIVPFVRIAKVPRHRLSLPDQRRADVEAIKALFGTLAVICWPIYTIAFVVVYMGQCIVQFVIEKQIKQEERRERQKQTIDANRCNPTDTRRSSSIDTSAPETES